MYNELRSCYENINSKLIKKYYFNNNSISKSELLKHIKNMVKYNNYIFYKELKQNNFNYAKVNQVLMDYKQVKHDILQNGLIYHFRIEF